jgi:hypothetical protein
MSGANNPVSRKDRDQQLPDDRSDRLTCFVWWIGGNRSAVLPEVTTEPIKGLQPYTALQLAGRDIYIREGCYNCHSQMIRPFRRKPCATVTTLWLASLCTTIPSSGAASVPVLIWHRVGGKYSDEWHRIHLNNPRDVVPESNMPAYVWLEKAAGGSC